MQYPTDFAQSVRLCFPDNQILHNLLREGSLEVGRILRNSRGPEMNPGERIAKIRSGKSDIVELADRKEIAKSRLYDQWRQLYKNMN